MGRIRYNQAMQFEELRRRHNALVYESFQAELKGQNLSCSFRFKLEPDIVFSPSVTIHKVPANTKISHLENLIFHVGLAEIPSYWKAACPPKIIIKAGKLNPDQLSWWNNLLIKGLGEFFFTNGIDFTQPDIVSWTVDSSRSFSPSHDTTPSQQIFIPIGGGKDSVVTLNLLKHTFPDLKTITLNPTSAAMRIINHAQTKNISISRQIAPQLLELNQQGYLNGHTPFSSYLAFLTTLTAEAFGGGQIVLSNENSSNESNLEYHGQQINHQYSKTYEFEQNFREYSASHLTQNSTYFSFLRPLYELQISQLFSSHSEYLPLIKSCNSTKITDGWCGICPKCLFAFTILYPFVNESELVEVFEKNLFADESLIPLVAEMTGSSKNKPFECVGTYEETKIALFMSIQKHTGKLPKLLEYAQEKIIAQETDWNKRANMLLNSWNSQNFVPKNLVSLLKLANLNKQKILILGMGREGQDTLEFLQQHLPAKHISTADKTQGENYLDEIQQYDVIFKTPGIPILTPQIQQVISRGVVVTSQTQLFFELCPGTIIGVTGTKGKSTTASLIAHILQQANLPAKLIGNIGTPVLSELDRATSDSIYVYELSSFQLQGLSQSPHIAVVLNITSEHLDYHQTTDEYVAAKSHITKHQLPTDIVVYNHQSKTATAIAELSPGKQYPFNRNQVANIKTQLKGSFNLDNIAAATTVAKLFNIREDSIMQAISSFKPLEHRLEFVGKYRGIDFYNDSLATTPVATIQAIKALGDNLETIMLGGTDRHPDLNKLAQTVNASHIKNVILFPDTGKKIWQAIESVTGSRKYNHVFAQDMKTAVEYAFEHTNPGKICLMSPSAPSFSMFKNYAERGEAFKTLVKQLSHEEKKS